MFELSIHDIHGVDLKEGDIVEVLGNRITRFFAEVKWLEKEQVLSPFHTFCFSGFVKVDSIPEKAIKSGEERFNMWYLASEDQDNKSIEDYLLSWRECEHLLDNRCFRIKKIQGQQKLF